jgi:formate dehydrogenase subunit gamma
MADSLMARAGSLAFAALFAVATGVAHAQAQQATPAPNAENSGPVAEAQRQQTQPLNNAPVWREIRSGTPATTTVTGRETNVLIQSRGETWRALRVPVVFWGGVLVALAILGLALFYMIRGPLDVSPEEKRQPGRLIERFSPLDRYAHWLLALIGYTLFSWLAILAKNLHNFVGPILIVAVPFLFVRFIRDNGFGMDDVRWFVNIVGYFKGHEYPSGRFNAGEKLVFWFVLVVLSTVLIVTGLVLVFPNFNQTRSVMQSANIIHMLAAYGAIALAFVHVYLGTIGMVDAYKAMRYGYVDEAWAKHHHLRWYEAIVAGRSRQHFADPKAVPPEATPGTQRPAAPRHA